MSFIHQGSERCAKSELDLFLVPPTQTQIDKSHYVEYQPISNIRDGGPLEFHVAGTGEEYIDLSKTQLYIEAKITNADGTDLAPNAPVGPVNLWMHSLFSDVDVYLNDQLVSTATGAYPYRAYLETLLNYGTEAKTDQLSMALWAKDTPGAMEVADPHAVAVAAAPGVDPVTPNDGLVKRGRYCARSRVIDMMGGLHLDVTTFDKLLLNNVSVKLKFVRSKNAFCLMSTTPNADYRVVLTEAVLHVRKVRLEPAVGLSLAKALAVDTAKYPVRRSEVRTISIPQGIQNVNRDNLFTGAMPRTVVVGLVDTTAYNGSYTGNPFNFRHHNLNSLALYVDGESIPSKPLRPNYGDGRYMQCYNTLFLHLGKLFRDKGLQIDRDDYGQGYTLYAFDISPDACQGGHYNLVRQGNLKLELAFAAGLPNTVSLIVYAEFESILEIDQHRNVIFEYGV